MSDKWWARMPDATQIESAWEREMYAEGLAKYDASKFTDEGHAKDYAEGPAGKWLAKKLVPSAIDAISDIQSEVYNSPRMERDVKAATLSLPVETLAVMGVRALIDMTYSAENPELGATYLSVAKRIGAAIEMELNYWNWVQSSKANARAYAQATGRANPPKSFAEKRIEEEGVSSRKYRRLKKQISELNEFKWTEKLKGVSGDIILHAILKANPESFKAEYRAEREKTPRRVKMTEECRRKFDDKDSQIGSGMAVKKPMLARPRKWTKDD